VNLDFNAKVAEPSKAHAAHGASHAKARNPNLADMSVCLSCMMLAWKSNAPMHFLVLVTP
jgi:hypothetical protein